jgi:hypothetical protein
MRGDTPTIPRDLGGMGEAVQANDGLRAARLAHPSPRYPDEPLSRSELAELAAAEVNRRTGREVPIDAHYIAKMERGGCPYVGCQAAAWREVASGCR